MRRLNAGGLLAISFLSFAAVAQEAKPKDVPQFGWNGDHFFLQSPDGRYLFQPYGYVQTDFRGYTGDGAPPNTFTIRRARLGVQGRFDQYYEFAFLIDATDANSTLLRDAYVNVKYVPELQLTVGQMVEPFGQEVASVGVANIDFVERGLTSLLYPSTAGAFRSPGVMIHGDVAKMVSYWLGAFNGKGSLPNTTSEPEVIGRLRLYPFRSGSNEYLQGLAFGGAIGIGRSRGLSNEMSFSGVLPERAFNFFPSLPINGRIMRYNGDATLLIGPLGLRGEYDELHQKRDALDVGFTNLPEVVARAFYVNATFLLTGERRPENGAPKVSRPFLGPGSYGIGAWEVKARYSYLWAKADGDIGPNGACPTATCLGIPSYKNTVDEISFGLNWYPQTQIRYDIDVNIYRDKDAATVGGQPPQTFVVILQRIQFKF
jgi:hypothetical protein